MSRRRTTTGPVLHFLLCLSLLAIFVVYVLTSFQRSDTWYWLLGVAVFCITALTARMVGVLSTTDAKEPIAVMGLVLLPLVLSAPANNSGFHGALLASVAAQAIWAHIRYMPAFNRSASSRLVLLRCVGKWPLTVMLAGSVLVLPLFGIIRLLDPGAAGILDIVVIAGLVFGPPLGLGIRIEAHIKWGAV